MSTIQIPVDRELLDFVHQEVAVALAFLGRGPGGMNNLDPARWADMCSQIGTSLAEVDKRVLAASAAGREAERAASKANVATHELYGAWDADAPDAIKDSNGEVVLAACRRCNRGEAQLEDGPCPGLVEDAERWRALLACERIRLLGSTVADSETSDYVHFGAEFWSQHPDENRVGAGRYRAKQTLIAFADAARRVAGFPAWRCHSCKRVVRRETEPEQCMACQCRSVSRCDQ